MTARRQFCPSGHDTLQVGRDSSYRCLRCKADSGKVARDRRRAEMEAAQRATEAEHLREVRRGYKAWRRRVERFQKAQQRKEKQ